MHRERENMSKYSTRLLGFGDNVVDIYDHLKTMYPGGNCVNVSVYGRWPDVKKQRIWDISEMTTEQN